MYALLSKANIPCIKPAVCLWHLPTGVTDVQNEAHDTLSPIHWDDLSGTFKIFDVGRPRTITRFFTITRLLRN